MRQLDALRFLGAAPPDTPVYGETARCIAYMCPWAYACPIPARFPAAVDSRECIRYRARAQRPGAGLSEMAVDVLADQRRRGASLGRPTTALLDDLRPDGPSRNLGLRRPAYPATAQ